MSNMEKCGVCGRLAIVGDTVTISATEYEALTQAAAFGRLRRSISKYRSVSRSGIGLNPELANFILDKVETMTIGQVHAACLERYGDKTPSRSSIFRFVDKMRHVGRD